MKEWKNDKSINEDFESRRISTNRNYNAAELLEVKGYKNPPFDLHELEELLTEHASRVAVAFAEWISDYNYYGDKWNKAREDRFYTASELFERFKSENK